MRILTFILCLVTLRLVGQSVAPKNSNSIVIETKDDIDTVFRNFGRILLKEGFTLEQSDKTFYVLTTAVRSMKYGIGGLGTIEVKFYVQFDETDGVTSLNLTGRYSSEQLFTSAGGLVKTSTLTLRDHLLKRKVQNLVHLVHHGI